MFCRPVMSQLDSWGLLMEVKWAIQQICFPRPHVAVHTL